MTQSKIPSHDPVAVLRDEVATAAEHWANAEYADAKSRGAGGPDKAEECGKAEDKFCTLLDKLTTHIAATERAATQPAGPTILQRLYILRSEASGHACTTGLPHCIVFADIEKSYYREYGILHHYDGRKERVEFKGKE
jgi:hypothetical protein